MNKWTQLVSKPSYNFDDLQPLSAPLYQTATFAQDYATEAGQFDYSRSGNPTRQELESKLAQLENGRYGFAFNSGLSAITTVLELLNHGDHIIIADDLYGGTNRLVDNVLTKRGIDVTRADLSQRQITDVIKPNTRLVLIETPSNPYQKIIDINQISHHLKGKDILFAVDNSLLSCWLQKPLNFDADIVLSSATKHLSGHSDVTAGIVVTRNKAIAEKIAFYQNALGNALAPFPSWLLLRSIKTLGLRVEHQQQSTLVIANYLQTCTDITDVYYVGLESHPGHSIHNKQADGPGTVISFRTGDLNKSKHIVENTRLFQIAVSFGSVNSTISLPHFMSHASSQSNIKPDQDLIRLSIGIEDPINLIEDLSSAINYYHKKQEAFHYEAQL